MKKIFHITITILLFWGCDAEEAPNCLKTTGNIIEVALEVAPFSEIEIHSELNVTIAHGPEQLVTLTTGKNLVGDVYQEVINGKLVIANNSSCHWTRPYQFPAIKITHPDITRIRQAGSSRIQSDGVLSFPMLSLISENQSGDFQLEVNCEKLIITNNEVSNYYLSGKVDNLKVGFYSGDGRFEGANLQAKNVTVFHRGTNDIIVHARETLKGQIKSSGDLVYVKTAPPIIEVSIENLGKLIDKTE